MEELAKLAAEEYATRHIGTPEKSTLTSGGHTLIAKYTGYLTDHFTLSVLGGRGTLCVANDRGFDPWWLEADARRR